MSMIDKKPFNIDDIYQFYNVTMTKSDIELLVRALRVHGIGMSFPNGVYDPKIIFKNGPIWSIEYSRNGLLYGYACLPDIYDAVIGNSKATSFVIDSSHRIKNKFIDCKTIDEVKIMIDLLDAGTV